MPCSYRDQAFLKLLVVFVVVVFFLFSRENVSQSRAAMGSGMPPCQGAHGSAGELGLLGQHGGRGRQKAAEGHSESLGEGLQAVPGESRAWK